MKRRLETRKPSAADLADKKIQAAVDKAAVDALRPVVKEYPGLLLMALQPHHVTALTVAVIATYLEQRRLAELMEDLNDDISDIGVA